MNETVGIKLDAETKDRLRVLGRLRDRSPHWLMRAAITQFLEREETYEREKREDAERWERYVLTGEAFTSDEVGAWLESVGSDHELPPPRR